MSSALFDEIAAWIDQGVAPGGAVALVAPGAKPAYFAHGHLANSSSPRATPNTVYDVASITKLFTTALILRLHERKQLSINDRCALYLSNFQHSNVRIIDLLTHRLGVDLSLAQFSIPYSDATDFREALLALEPPQEPLDHVAYANLQLVYAGLIVEHVTGRGLRTELHQLFDQLNLSHTYTGPDIAEHHIVTPPTEATTGTVVQGVTHDESSRLLGGIAGNAGVFSSVTDLLRFGQAWLDGAIVRRQTAKELVFKDYDPDGTTPQALGWWLRVTNPDSSIRLTPGIYSHTGFTGSFLGVNPNNGKVAAFTCNRTYYGRDNKRQRHVWQSLVTWLQS